MSENNAGRSNSGTNTQTDKQTEDFNSWLPITASRKAKWWYSTFHNVTAVVGAGVLGLPYAFSQLGWVPGLVTLVLSWLVTFYSFWQLVELHEMVPGKRFDRYTELGQHAFGKKLGYWLVMPQQMVVQVASDIVFVVTGGNSLKKSFDMLHPWFNGVRKTYFILVFGFCQLILSQVPNFNSLKLVSVIAAVMSFSLGTIAFAYAGHSVSLEIQATIPSTPDKPSKKPMWKGVIFAYIIVGICYLCVSVSGFWAFGDSVDDDILVSLEKPYWLIILANFMVFIHVLGSYQVFAMPVFDMMESYMVKRRNFSPGRPLRLIARSTYVVFTAFVGICLPFFGGLLGFFGGLAFSSTSYFIPCIIWIVLKQPKRWSFHWTASWVCIIIGVIITVLAPIGGLRSIIISFKTYKMFS